MQRRLTTILAADVVGYSGLMAADEAGTLASLKAIRSELIEPKTAKHSGRVVKLMGDGTLMEFGSVVDAVNFAVDVQRAMAERNAEIPEDRQLAYRIGINIGDIIVEGDDIYGDGVNIATRLEGLADPGGICVSRSVHTHIEGKVDVGFEDLGKREVKNIPKPVQVFRVLMDASVTERHPATAPAKRPLSWPVVGVSFAVFVIVFGLAIWEQPWEVREETASEANMAFPLPDKPSIAVLPFNNMSEDQNQEYFADGMTEDLITDLSKISGLFVIARNSSFSYKGQQVKVREVAEELGVRYVLEGSVRRAGDEVRINAQLIDATTGGHLWAERYDGTLDDVFDLQDRVTGEIVTALSLELTPAEEVEKAHHATDNAAAHDAYLQGWARYKLQTPEDLTAAIPFFEEAIRLDPSYAQAHAALAALYWDVLENDWAFDLGMPSSRAEEFANGHLDEALKDPTPLAHVVQSKMFASYGSFSESFFEDAVTEARKAVALDESDATALAGLADMLIRANQPDEALAQIEKAMRLDPHHPPSYLIILGAAQFGMEKYEEAAATFERAVKRNPGSEFALVYLASAYGHLGRISDADDIIDHANALRDLAGLEDLSLVENTVYAFDLIFDPKINFGKFGSRQVQELVRAGLTEIPALKWQYLITMHRVLGPRKMWGEVKGATLVDIPRAKELHDRGVKFIDLSAKGTWDLGHIPGAIHFYQDYDSESNPIRFTKANLLKIANPDDEIVLYYDNGAVAIATYDVAKAVTWGFSRVYYFNGGAYGWEKAGYPIESGE